MIICGLRLFIYNHNHFYMKQLHALAIYIMAVASLSMCDEYCIVSKDYFIASYIFIRPDPGMAKIRAPVSYPCCFSFTKTIRLGFYALSVSFVLLAS